MRKGNIKIAKKVKSQIATIIVFIIAIIFIFVLITINISKVAQKKTVIDNIADSVGLGLASQLGSMANAIKHEFEIYGFATERCDWNWQLAVGLGLFAIVVAIVACLTFGWGGAVVAALGSPAVLGGLALGGALWTIMGVSLQFVATSPGALEQMRIKFQNMSALQQVIESPVQGVLFGLVDDPAWVKDDFDMDRDKDKNDLIPRFFKWYNLRLNTFPRIGTFVENFLSSGGVIGRESFFIDGAGKPRFYIDEDENLMVKKGKDSVRWWVDSNDEDEERDLKLVPWFREELSNMLREMRRYGYGINVRVDGAGRILEITDSGLYYYEDMLEYTWIYELEEFENTIVRNLYNMDFDSALQGVDVWLPYLRNPDNKDWSTRLRYFLERAIELKSKLTERKDQINLCVKACGQNEWDCCGGSGPCCQWECCGWDEYGNCTGDCCVETMGCCGAWIDCGRLCNDEHCKPTYRCSTPLGGLRWCCEVTNLEPYNNPTKGCYDNIVDVYPNRDDKRHNAIEILNKFINDLVILRNLIDKLYVDVTKAERESYDKMHEAFYVWQDKVGGDTAEPQLVGHIAYVKIEGLDPKAGFTLPYPERVSKWNWLINAQICISVKNATGDFTLTIARFDESTAKKGPLKRFWTFRFGRPGISAADENYIRSEAERLKNSVNANQYYEVSDKGRLINILSNYGIVTKVRVHYGPGETQKDQESVSPANQNRDIYIMSVSSSM